MCQTARLPDSLIKLKPCLIGCRRQVISKPSEWKGFPISSFYLKKIKPLRCWYKLLQYNISTCIQNSRTKAWTINTTKTSNDRMLVGFCNTRYWLVSKIPEQRRELSPQQKHPMTECYLDFQFVFLFVQINRNWKIKRQSISFMESHTLTH